MILENGQVTVWLAKVVGQLNGAVAATNRDPFKVEVAAENEGPVNIALIVGTEFGKLIETWFAYAWKLLTPDQEGVTPEGVPL